MHKAWLSQRLDREPIKKKRDLEQAQAVVQAVIAEMPQLSFQTALTSLPEDVRKMHSTLMPIKG